MSAASTSSPRARNAATSAPPRPPAPPVTNTLIGAPAGSCSVRAQRAALAISWGGSSVLLDLKAGDHAAVHLIGSVRESQGPRVGPHPGQREVAGETAAAVQLHRHVDDLLGDVGDDHLDLADLAQGVERATDIQLPRRVEHEQPGLVDGDPGIGDPLAVAAEVDDRLAERRTGQSALDRQLERDLGLPDQAHAVVHAARPEPSLRDLEGASLAEQDVLLGHAHVVEADLAVADRG